MPQPGEIGGETHKENAAIRVLKHEVIAQIKSMVAQLGVPAAVEVIPGSVGEIVPESAVVEHADLIVIGPGHLPEPMGHLRTHAYEIIWNAPCPVLRV